MNRNKETSDLAHLLAHSIGRVCKYGYLHTIGMIIELKGWLSQSHLMSPYTHIYPEKV